MKRSCSIIHGFELDNYYIVNFDKNGKLEFYYEDMAININYRVIANRHRN